MRFPKTGPRTVSITLTVNRCSTNCHCDRKALALSSPYLSHARHARHVGQGCTRGRVYWVGGWVGIPRYYTMVLPGPNPWDIHVQTPISRVPYSSPRTSFSGSHIAVPGPHSQGPIFSHSQGPRCPIFSHSQGPRCPNSAKTGPNSVKTVLNSAKTVLNTVILRCTRGLTRPFDWVLTHSGASETCIPTARYL